METSLMGRKKNSFSVFFLTGLMINMSDPAKNK